MSAPVKSEAEIQRDSDVIVLTAALHGVKMRIGAERFAAAQSALPRRLQPETQEVAATAAPSPSGAEQASIDETLALARAAGVGRFGAAVAEGGAASPPHNGNDTLALAREAGIGRYGQ